ncbi:MAG: hypothetical protein JXC36_09185 [Candidatus Atribacteria bacterium]|nr:hypothetical protein [Candidatus Atribacteria bacterium]
MNVPISYFDWQKEFKKETKKPIVREEPVEKNPIGIENKLFSQYVKCWKEKNLKKYSL